MTSEGVTIRRLIDTPRSKHLLTTTISIFSVVGALAVIACDASEPETTAPPPTTASSATTGAPSPSTTSPPATDRTLDVPNHTPPVIDGVLNGGEWDGSATVTMTDGSSLH